ncbi:MAG: DUF4105 domain-containing protein, partial [Methylococcaceae bacterium]|nr:DUF4105 domain-containing protein [Methylococcaceae bacterium]
MKILNILKGIKWSLLTLMLIVTTVWAVLAIYFGDSHTGILQTAIAAVVGCFGLATLVSLGFTQWRKRFLVGYAILFVLIVSGWWFAVQPSNDRQWQADLATLPFATVEGDFVTVHNIRNIDYRSEFDYSTAYYDKTFDLNALKGIDLFAVYWMGPAIAHTILSFNFGEKGHLAVSIEARK